jgi:L-2-hydroxycarboxylate dehydrogenase (NAD+)
MEIPIDEVHRLMQEALELRGINRDVAELIASDYLGAELEGRATHGIGKFLLVDSALAQRVGSPEVISDLGALVLVDGHRELGHVAASFCARLAAERASTHGVAIVALRNASRFSRLGPFASQIANEGLIALVTNNAGPPAVAPYGAASPVLGTNPLCFAFPGLDHPTVIDFATSQAVWGEIRQAVLEERELPAGAFLDGDGQLTRDPQSADAVLPFGGAKGSALCLAIELLVGALAGAAMGGKVDSEYALGAVFVAAQHESGFGEAEQALIAEIRSATPLPGHEMVCVPGESSRARRDKASARGTVVIDRHVLARLTTMSTSPGGGLLSDDKVN